MERDTGRKILGARYWEYILGGSCWEGAAEKRTFGLGYREDSYWE